MRGWNGKLLYINLTKREFRGVDIDKDILRTYLGGRGLAVRYLWELNKPGIDPLSEGNHLILATGPLTGYPLPSSGKMVVASKSPLTGGYGDGNIGTRAAVELRKSDYDAVIITGASDKPVMLRINCRDVEFLPADDLWGLGLHEAENRIYRKFGKNVGVLFIGPGGENLVKFATIVSEYGRSGGRPGIGAVMGAKKLKAVIFEGCGLPEPSEKSELMKLGGEAYRKVKESEGYGFWIRQGTMMTIEWSQKNSVLPTYNFREGVFEGFKGIDGYAMERIKVSQKGCPLCNMPCGNMVSFETPYGKSKAELDYENVAMLGSNLGIDNLHYVSHLNDLADDFGVDTISLGSVLAFAMEASEKGLIKDEKLEWGDFKGAYDMVFKIVKREGIGDVLAEGVRKAAETLVGNAADFAIHVKGLEVSAYDCHAAPGMALAYATSSIGAHHKDAWFISLEIKMGRDTYSAEKVEKLVWMQNVRGGLFESFVTCRLPWVELGLDLEYYRKFLHAATGIELTWDDLHEIANRIYTLIRAFWVREYVAEGRGWSREMDSPPTRWFKEPLTKGPLKGSKLDREKYEFMLSKYYELRGWDRRGIPRKSTLSRLGLSFVIDELSKMINLED